MLQAIRERAQGWFAWAIVILISVPFALWGIQEYLRIRSQPVVATVNGSKIGDRELTQHLQKFRMELRQRLGHAYRPELFDNARMRDQVLEDMIRGQLIVQRSLDMGLRAGDAQVQATILAIPAFQKGGHFDKAVYEQALSRQGTNSLQFEQKVRMSLMTAQLARVIASSEFATEQELDDAARLRRQKRSFNYFLIPLQQFKRDAPLADKDLSDYYQAHQDAFAIPEQVKVDYLVLGQGGAAGSADVAEATLREMYQNRINNYEIPEKRHIRHILIALAADAKPAEEQAARDKIAAIRARIAGGADFATVAKEVSQDPGSASQGGDLGLVGRGIMDPEFEKAAFALPRGELSAPVRSAFGFHLIEVTQIEPKRVKPFAEVRDELAAAARMEQLDQHYLQLAERLGNLTYEHPDSLEPAAQALGLEIQHSDWLSRSGGPDLLANRRVVDMAFSEDVLNQGNNSEVVEIDEKRRQRALVLRVVDHRDASIKPLAEVKDQVADRVRREQAKQAALARAGDLAGRLRQGEALAQVAVGYKIAEHPLAQRDAAKEVPPEVLESVFKLPPGDPKTPSIGVVQLSDGSAAVVMLQQIQDGQLADLDKLQRKSEARGLTDALARAYYNDMVEDLRRRADVWIEPLEAHATPIE
jgi:peptidyl-prolyl cis-trans isomerase D